MWWEPAPRRSKFGISNRSCLALGQGLALFRLGLVDEFWLIVHPVVQAGGLALFSRAMDLKLMGSKAFPGGAVALTYRRV
jgi:hypothetical protein